MLEILDAFNGVDVPRSAAAIRDGRIPVTLGGRTFVLPVLSRRASREWKNALEDRFARSLSPLQINHDASAILMALTSATDPMLDALIEFDQTHVLPSRDEIEDQANDVEIVRALAEVWLAANPLIAIATAKIATVAAAEAAVQAAAAGAATAAPEREEDVAAEVGPADSAPQATDDGIAAAAAPTGQEA